MISINGAEGGGQVLRTALALSIVTKKPFRITDIRKERPQPGLKNQHLFCIKALQELFGAEAEGAELGSKEITFEPGELVKNDLEIDIGTAGSKPYCSSSHYCYHA